MGEEGPSEEAAENPRPRFTSFLRKGTGKARTYYRGTLARANANRKDMPRFHPPTTSLPPSGRTTGMDSGLAQSQSPSPEPPISPIQPTTPPPPSQTPASTTPPPQPEPQPQPPPASSNLSRPSSVLDSVTTQSFESLERDVNAGDVTLGNSSALGHRLFTPSSAPHLLDPDVSPAIGSLSTPPNLQRQHLPPPPPPCLLPAILEATSPATPDANDVFQRPERSEAARATAMQRLTKELADKLQLYKERLGVLDAAERLYGKAMKTVEEERGRLAQREADLRRREGRLEAEEKELETARKDLSQRQTRADALTKEEERARLLREKCDDLTERMAQRDAELAKMRSTQRKTEQQLRDREDEIAEVKEELERSKASQQNLQASLARQRNEFSRLKAGGVGREPMVVLSPEPPPLPQSSAPAHLPPSAGSRKSVRFADEEETAAAAAAATPMATAASTEWDWRRTEDEGCQTGASLMGASPLRQTQQSRAQEKPRLRSMNWLPDGREESLFSNGTRKTVSADGNEVVFHFSNGDVRRMLKSGEVEEEYTFAANGTIQRKMRDGSLEHRFKDGRREVIQPSSGRKIIYLPSGEKHTIKPDNTKVVVPAPGSGDPIRCTFSDGRVEERFGSYTTCKWSDGRSKTEYYNTHPKWSGMTVGRYPSGRVYIKDGNDYIFNGYAEDIPKSHQPLVLSS